MQRPDSKPRPPISVPAKGTSAASGAKPAPKPRPVFTDFASI